MKLTPREIWQGFEWDGPEWVVFQTPVEQVPQDLQGAWEELQRDVRKHNPDDLPQELQDRVEQMVDWVADLIWGTHY
jgi:hypothetical protein